MPHHHRRRAAMLTAVLLTALLPSTAFAAAPQAVDDPSAACGNTAFGGAFPIPEDWSGGSPEEYARWFQFIDACNPLANDTDAEGDPLTIDLVGQPAHGQAVVGDGTVLSYLPDPDYSTIAGHEPGGDWFSDAITYRAFDGSSYSNEAALRLWIMPINDPPTFTPGPATVDVTEDSGEYSAPWATDISAGPANESAQTVTFEITDIDYMGLTPDVFAVQPAIASDGTLTFTPGPDQAGLVTVTVRAKDDGGIDDLGQPGGTMDPPDDTSDETNFQIVVEPVNDAPVANDDPGAQCGPIENVGGSYLLPEYDPETQDQGTLWFVWDCTLLSNDTDADGDALTFEILDPPSHGILTTNDEGFLGYEMEPDYGTRPGNVPGGTWVSDSFTYRAFDGIAYSEPATMRFWVAEINDAPSFLPGADVTVGQDSGPYVAPWASAISVGPASEAWQQMSFEVDVAGGGTLFASQPIVSADGTLSFTPATGGTGSAVVTIQAHDDGGVDDHGIGTPHVYPDDTSDPVTFTITVTDLDTPPTAGDDFLTIAEDAPGALIPVLANDVNPDTDPLTITHVTDPALGTATIAGHAVLYTADPDAFGTDTFTYTVSDGSGSSDTATVIVTITPVNDRPVAADDAASIPSGPAVAIPVLANDTDVDGDARRIVATTNGAKGTVAITGGGTGLTYDPTPLATGTDTFTYTISDGHGGSDTATVTVTITPDTTGPLITTVSESLPGQTIGTNTVRARLSWHGTDPASGINNYHVQVSVGGGPWSGVALAGPTATSVDRTLTFGESYRFRVRAKDLSGNVGAFREWAPLTLALYQETSAAAKYTGAWATAGNPVTSGGATRYAGASDRKVTIAFTGRDVGWVATRRTSSGMAQVRIDGVLVATVDLGTAKDAFRQLVLARHFSTVASHKLEIRPIGDGRVDLDAIVVLR